jgi:hypothetical protein
MSKNAKTGVLLALLAIGFMVSVWLPRIWHLI